MNVLLSNDVRLKDRRKWLKAKINEILAKTFRNIKYILHLTLSLVGEESVK